MTDSNEGLLLYSFSNLNTVGWYVIDDGVMGGLSQGSFSVEEHLGVFSGSVSTKNNGGFSSIRCPLQKTFEKQHQYFQIRIKGDGKRYQFRIKEKSNHYYNYIYHFETNGAWQTINIPIEEMVPSFRGRILDLNPYAAKELAEMGFLIGNKKPQEFQLMIDSISIH